MGWTKLFVYVKLIDSSSTNVKVSSMYLTKAGSRDEPIGAPSFCWCILPSNIKGILFYKVK